MESIEMGRNREYWDKKREFDAKVKNFREEYFPKKKQSVNYEQTTSNSKLSSKDIFFIILFILFVMPFYLLFIIFKFIFTHKPVLIIFIIASIGISGFFILKNVLGKSNATAEKTTDIVEAVEDESLPGKDVGNVINETITVDSTDTEPVNEETDSTVKVFFANKLLTKITDKLKSTELFYKITDIPQQKNLLYIIGYSLLTLWIGLGGIFLLASILIAIIAVFNRKFWRNAGSSLLSSFLTFISIAVLYYAFGNIFERSVTEVSFSNVLTIIAFALFVFSNIAIIVLLCAKSRKANWGTAIKMIITAVVIYIPLIILIGRY
jgi:hypothetical protein